MLKNGKIEMDITVAFVKILMSNDISDKVKELRLSALKELYNYLEYYEESGYLDKLINKIAEKKISMIMEITTKEEKEKVVKPNPPRFYGNKCITDKYNVPEEELICWSETSIIAPLNEVGFKRYMELFKKVFPDEEREIFKESYEENDNEDEFDEPNM